MADHSSRSHLLGSTGDGDSDGLQTDYSVQFKGSGGGKPIPEGRVTWFVVVLTGFSAVGMFLFGYDTGVVSGSMLLLKKQFNLNNIWQETIVSVTIGVASVFAFLGGPVNELIGRKYSGILSGVLFTVGAVMLGAAQSKGELVGGRVVVGIGLGISSMTLPMYVSECAPTRVRGRLVQISGTFGTIGFLVSNIVDGFFSYDEVNGWRYMLGIAAVPSLVMTVGFMFLPESPRWLVSKRKVEKAKRVLQKIRCSEDVTEELLSIKRSCEENEETSNRSSNRVLRILAHPPTRRALIVGCSLQLFQQAAGINTIMYYTATVIKSAGITDDHQAIWLSAGVAAVNVGFSVVGLMLVDNIGRRKLILASYLGVIVSLVVVAVGFQLVAIDSPPITVNEVDSPCQHRKLCEGCIRSEDCGFCFQGKGENGSCLPVNPDVGITYSSEGRCSKDNITSSHTTWAYTYCPTNKYWVPLVGICMYIVSFAPGLAGIPWLMNAEIYPPWARSTGNALSTATNWLMNVVVSMTFLTLVQTLTKFGVYWLYTGVSVVGIIFLAYVLPETKGKSLEETEKLFSRRWC